MKRTLLFAIATLMLGAGNLWAQTDVTSTYITNAGFDGCTAETSDVDAKTIKDYSSNGWTNAKTGSFTTIAVTAYGGGKKVGGSTTPGTKKDGATVSGNTLGIIAGWGDEVKIQSGDITLPAGVYTLTVDHYLTSSTNNYGSSSSIFGFVTNSTSYLISSTTFTAATWTTETVSFTLTESTTGKIQIGLNGLNKSGSTSPAVFYDDVTLTYVPLADATDYANLNTAILAVEGKAWGFDQGEYAPYNNVGVPQALATAKAIDQDAENPKSTIQALTSTLNTATVNTEEVNAIWDPSFEYSYSTSGNVQPIAWTGTTNHNNATDVRWMWNVSSNAGLNATSSTKALFTKFGVHYGQQEGYTLPLNADTYYTISFVYGGWSDCKKDGYVTMADPSSTSLTLIPSSDLPLDAVDGYSSSASWKNYQAFFKTNDAGNYVLGLRKKDESKQSQYVYGDFVLKTTTVAEATAYYNSVKDAVEGDYDADANGGSEKTAFKAALDADVPSTVAEIMEAAANLYTLRDAFVAATPKYDALETERASAIALGVSSSSANAVTMTSASQLQEKLQALYVLEDAAATSQYAVNATTLFGSWTTQNMDTKSGEHWSGDASRTYYDRWQNSGFTSSITNTMTLPAGKYVFKVAARAQEGGINGAFNMSVTVGDAAAVQKDFVAKSATGYGIETSGVANYSEGGTYANTTGRGWEWRFIGFELNESASVTMTAYAQILANKWVGFSDATLLTTSDNIGALKNLLQAEITTAAAINTTSNVGEGVFQIPSSAVTTFGEAKTAAQTVYDNASATSSDVSDAIDALKAAEETYKNSVNAPDASKHYNITVATSGHAKKDNAIIIVPGETTVNNPTGYALNANFAPSAHLAQAVTFTQVSGNIYNISFETADGTAYLTYGTTNGSAAGWSDSQIQATTDGTKKGEFKIVATETDNVFNIVNTLTNTNINCQDGGNIYTDGTTGFAVAEASQAEVALSITAGKVATRIFPFTPSLPSGVEAYSCSSNTGTSLTLTLVDAPVANAPYILYSENGYSGDALTGWGTASQDSYENGYLTGVYTRTEVPQGSYVLQTQDDTQAFYKVDQTGAYSSAYRVFVTVPAAGVKSFGFTFNDMETAIEAARAEGMNTVTLRYNIAGQQVGSANKGLNIIKMADGTVRKVMVK